ncbi:uncharacterized protein LOC133714351 [Rosa rugosa]|uniref:uncharacterized protein LOC133714351 n=1 Tax=Rosa rugosa TaxID=74645 RepID=UPI002B407A25|nr:uncharacterized protein LOC133714351 [Rosa rugosa]
MAFATDSRVSIILLLVLVLAAAALAHNEGNDHATPPIRSPNPPSPSSDGSGSAEPEGLVDVGLCAIQCGAKCFGRKASLISPDKFRFPKIHFGGAFCFGTCMLECTMNQGNVKPELYHCTLGCAYKFAAKTKLTGSDAHRGNNYLGPCYNKCEKNHQG